MGDMTDSKPQHEPHNPRYPGRPRIWTDPDTGNVIIGTADGDVLFSLNPRHAEAVSDLFNKASNHATAQREQAIYLHKLNRERAIDEFRRAFLRENSHRDIHQSELEKQIRYFSDDFDRERGFNPFEEA